MICRRKSIALRIAAYGTKLRINAMFRQLNPGLTGGTPLRVGAVIAIDVNKVAGMCHPIDVLAVALLLVLLRGPGPGLWASNW